MNFELIKRDPSWRVGLFLAAAALFVPAATQSAGLLGGMCGSFFMVAIMAVRPHQRATLFEAGLPVSARDLFLSRLAALWSIVWMPAVTASLSILLFGQAEWLIRVLEMAALMAVLLLIPMALRVKELRSPQWQVAIAWLIVFPLGIAGIAGHLSPAVFLPLCALAGAAIFWHAWTSLPPSFQTAPFEPARQRRLSPGRWHAPVWWILCFNGLPWWGLLYLVIIVQWSATGDCLYAFLLLRGSVGPGA